MIDFHSHLDLYQNGLVLATPETSLRWLSRPVRGHTRPPRGCSPDWRTSRSALGCIQKSRRRSPWSSISLSAELLKQGSSAKSGWTAHYASGRASLCKSASFELLLLSAPGRAGGSLAFTPVGRPDGRSNSLLKPARLVCLFCTGSQVDSWNSKRRHGWAAGLA